LAAHTSVEGASELPYLYKIIGKESARRGKAFPLWVRDASDDDWAQMGRQYFERSARWRRDKPISKDKLPANWLLAGAALAMLPGSKVVVCERDMIETCWSCDKQLFAKDMVGFAYDFESLAAYAHDFQRLSAFWAQHHPTQFRIQSCEKFVANLEPQVRDLLEFCGLPFDVACLRFQDAKRSIRTPSAAQVRQPLSKDTAGCWILCEDYSRRAVLRKMTKAN
jgi:Sulfotransferase family